MRKVAPRAKAGVEELRDDLFKEHGYEDDKPILNYFVLMHKKLKAKELVLVAIPPALRKLLEKQSKKAIDTGKSKSEGDFIRQYLLKKWDSGW